MPNTTELFINHAFGALKNAGVTVKTAQWGTCSPLSQVAESLHIHSAPLIDVLNTTLQNSDNLYAESFLRIMGDYRRIQQPQLSTREGGLLTVSDFLTRVRQCDNWV